MTTKNYEYAPLSTSPQEFRIVHLLPGRFYDPICCELITALLDHPPPYKTLSYVWGDPTITRTIKLHGTNFEATDSLFRALRRYRLKVGVFAIWVDALCINQMDIGERGSQVGVMGKIYERCEEVWVWLGEDFVDGGVDGCVQDLTTQEEGSTQSSSRSRVGQELDSLAKTLGSRRDESSVEYLKDPTIDTRTVEETGRLPWIKIGDRGEEVLDWKYLKKPDFGSNEILAALAVVNILGSGRHFRDMPCFRENSDTDEDPEYMFTALYELAESGFDDLFDLPYWERIWVLQEMALPPIAYMVYGSQRISWETFASIVPFVRLHMAPCCSPPALLVSSTLQRLPTAFLNLLSVYIEPMNIIQNEMQLGRKLETARMLRHTFLYRSANPLDKIYGVLGMIEESQTDPALSPDYEIDLQELCRRVMLSSIKHTGTLESLLGGRMFHNEEFPSWVLDWTQGRTLFMDGEDKYVYEILKEQLLNSTKYSASLEMKTEVKLIGTCFLLLDGTYVDRVTVMFEVVEWDEEAESNIVATCEALGEYESSVSRHPESIAGGSWKDAIWRTICGDILFDVGKGVTKRSIPTDKQFYHMLIETSSSTVASSESTPSSLEFREYVNGIEVMTLKRRVFITEQGYLGLGPEMMEVGDEVFVCHGSPMPFVLRKMDVPDVKADEEDDVEFPVYELIGECYTHGIMDGEVIKQEGREIVRLALR